MLMFFVFHKHSEVFVIFGLAKSLDARLSSPPHLSCPVSACSPFNHWSRGHWNLLGVKGPRGWAAAPALQDMLLLCCEVTCIPRKDSSLHFSCVFFYAKYSVPQCCCPGTITVSNASLLRLSSLYLLGCSGRHFSCPWSVPIALLFHLHAHSLGPHPFSQMFPGTGCLIHWASMLTCGHLP